MGDIRVHGNTQTIVVKSQQRIVVDDRVANVINSHQGVAVINSGPPGPPGTIGPPGPPGTDADTQVEVIMEEHVNSPEPHPAYDDIPDLTIHFENGLY